MTVATFRRKPEQPLPDDLKLLTTRQVMALLNVGRTKFDALTKSEGFPKPVLFGQSYRWPEQGVRVWLNNLLK